MPRPNPALLHRLHRVLPPFVCATVIALATLAPEARLSAAEPHGFAFDFAPEPAALGRLAVLPSVVYNRERGHGFEPGGQPIPAPRDQGARDRRSVITSDRPFSFSVAVPEGNHRVTVTLGDPSGVSDTTIRAELRRLMVERARTQSGELIQRTFIVNVRRPTIGTQGSVRLKDRERAEESAAWDEKLTLEFSGARPCVAAVDIEPAGPVPTIYLLGDSTVCDQPSEPYASWGQMLPRFFGSGVAVANHAQSGDSLRSAAGARRTDKVLSLLQPGDYLLVQYGHNDMKERGENVGAFTTYRASLEALVDAAQAKGARPILVTSVQRRTFTSSGTITNSLKDYPEAVRQVAQARGLPLVDLHAMSARFYEALGPEKSKQAFRTGDGTHHNNYGAYQLARCVVEGLRERQPDLAKLLATEVGRFDPSHPDAPDSFALPPSGRVNAEKPDGQ